MHRLSWQPPHAMLALLVSISFQAVNVYAQQPDPSDLLQESLPPKYVTLGECLEVALTFQPRILAELNSQLSTEIQANYLNKLRLVSHFSKPLNARIGQSEIGINRARAAIDQQIEDTYYMVRRAYFTYIFAKRLESFASPMENLVARTEKALAIKKLIEKPTGKWTSDHEKQLLILRAEHTLIKEKLNNAKAGIRESIALLMEEMGGGIKLGYQPIPNTTKFPTLSPNLSLEKLLDMVEKYSGDLHQVRAGRAAMELEVCAQNQFTFFRKSVSTFASFVDTKTIPLPAAERSESIVRPTVPGIETPHNLAGPRYVRIARASALAERARHVEDSVRNLLRLQMRRTYEEYVDIQENISILEDNALDSRNYLNGLSDKIFTDKDVPLITSSAQLVQSWERAQFLRCILLADMVRQTCGNFELDFNPPLDAPIK